MSRPVWRTLLSGLRLLTDAELIRDLGERRLELRVRAAAAAANPGAKLGRRVRFEGDPAGRLSLGAWSSVCDGTVLAFGDEVGGPGRIAVGPRTWIGPLNNLRAGGGDVTVGADCLIAQFCTLVAANHRFAAGRPILDQGLDPTRSGVRVEDGAWLAAGVTVTPGTTVGAGAVVGANAVVTRDVPPGEIWAGVPARRLGMRP